MTICVQEVSIHVYEKRGPERVGRGRRKEAIAELLRGGAGQVGYCMMYTRSY